MPAAYASQSLAVQFYTGFKGFMQKMFVSIMNTLDPSSF